MPKSYKCPAGVDCYGEQVCLRSMEECTEGLYCPGFTVAGTSFTAGASPDLCPKGYYCPSPTQKFKCPSGHFCPRGTSKPRPCEPFSICVEGSTNQFQYIGLLMGLVVPFIFLVGLRIYTRIRDKRRDQRDQAKLIQQPSLLGHSSSVNYGATSPQKSQHVSKQNQANQHQHQHQQHGEDDDMKPMLSHSGDDEHIAITFNKVCGGILKDFSYTLSAGRATCIMGPSGSGKTTLLNVLLGKIKLTGGRVTCNGAPWPRQDVLSVGYVPESDTMVRTITPKETLLYCAAYRLSDSYDAVKREEIVNSTLKELGLWHVRHTVIGDPEIQRGISGGQRKRANIGQELVALNPVLLVDGATSGLDATCAQEVCEALKHIASHGRIVMAVIHQPRTETFHCFDDVILLGKTGACHYAGPIDQCLPYFASLGHVPPKRCNPADFLVDLVCSKELPIYNSSSSSNAVEPDASTAVLSTNGVAEAPKVLFRTSPTFARQLLTFSRRATLQTMRDLRALMIAAFIQVMGGAMIGGASSPSRNIVMYVPPVSGSIAENQCPYIIRDRCRHSPLSQIVLQVNIFYLSMACGVGAISRAVSVFGEEKHILQRENTTGRSILAYYLARVLVDVPIVLFSTLLFTGVFMALAMPSGSFGSFMLAFFAMQFAACGLGYFVSLVTAEDKSMVVAIVTSIVFAICCGFHPTLNDVRSSFVFLEGLWALSFARWAGEAIYISEVSPYAADFAVQGGYDEIGYNPDNYGLDIAMTILLGLGWRVLAFVVLWIQKRRK